MCFFLLDKEIDSFVYKSSNSSLNTFTQLISFILIFAGILALTYFTTKYMGRMRIKTLTGYNISVVESMNLGIGLALYLLKVGEQYFLVSVSKDRVNLISEIESDNIKEVPKDEPKAFEQIMKEHMKEYIDKFGQRKK